MLRSRVRRGRARRQLLLGIGTTLALLGLWEVLARVEVLPEEIPPLSVIIGWLGGEVASGELWTSLGLTMWHWAAGLLIGAVAGISIGIAIGAIPLLQRLFQVPFELLRPIPSIVYLPLLILLFGGTSKTAIVCTAVGAFWPMMFQTYYGVRAIDPVAIETGRVFGLTRRQRLVSITLPSIVPFVATGVRISSSLALVVAVSVELIGGVPGLGADLGTYSTNGVYRGVYGIILVSGVLGLVLNLVLERTEARLLRWHVSHREVAS
jgi:ABC-type nitrate/sulfonate/bicarbonate transport system permease component